MNEREFKTGTLDDGTRLMQPPFDYVEEAAVTLSTSLHGAKVAKSHFLSRVNSGIEAANRLDQVKKTLFYGRDNNLEPVEGQNTSTDTIERVQGGANTVHGIIGIFTEAGELLEALRNAYNENILIDATNIKEELGDLFWYVAILCKEFGFTFDDIMKVNIGKLRARYPDKFTEHDAENRNLVAERGILEGVEPTGVVSDEMLPVETESPPVALAPSNPASGPEAVKAVEASADAAFTAVKAASPATVDAGAAMSPTPEMAKDIGSRQQDMPGENLARQPIRKSDAEK